MPIMAIYRSRDVTPEKYAPYESYIVSQPVPPGALLHQVAFDDEGGLCVVDIWNSREEMAAFAATQIDPNLRRFDIPVGEPEILEVATVATHNGIDCYKSLTPLQSA